MQIELRLRKVLMDHGLDTHGVRKEIAAHSGLHRHTVHKFYYNLHKNPSLENLGQICDWLMKNKVPAKILPGALFGSEASGLWPAVAQAGKVTIYLGEYQETIAHSHIPWVSKRDAAVVTEIVECLSTSGIAGGRPPVFATEYLPFREDSGDHRVRKKELERENSAAKRMYERMCANLKDSNAILVGSQRVNRLVETLVADLFGCEPFKPSSGTIRVPFYLAYQSSLRAVESCFGGLKNPPGFRGKFVKGTQYLNKEGEWVCVPWISKKQDSGVVITSYEPGAKDTLLAVFGLSGRATEALGRYLTQIPKPFWPPYAEKQGRKIGVYVCKITYAPQAADEPDELGKAKAVEVLPIDKKILTHYLNAK